MPRQPLDDFHWFISEQRSLQALIERFPREWAESDSQLKTLLAQGGAPAVLEAAKGSQAHLDRIKKSQNNPLVIKDSLPVLLRSRMMVLALKNYSLAAQTKTTGRIAFDEQNAALLQGVLFEGSGLVRKPVDLAHWAEIWPQVTQKTYLMPLVNKKGIYCFYTGALIQELKKIIGGKNCLEVGAGDGTLSRFLHDAGCAIKATDNHSWGSFISYPAEVENLDAAAALRKYKPEVVIASWPDPGNSWEQTIFESPTVKLYIMLGSAIPGVTGNPQTYARQKSWSLDERPDLAALLLPEEQKNTVLLFRR